MTATAAGEGGGHFHSAPDCVFFVLFFVFFLREPAVKPRRTVASEALPTYPVRKHTQLSEGCLVLLMGQNGSIG